MREILQEIFPVVIIPHSQLILHCQAATTTLPESKREKNMSMPRFKFSVPSKTIDP